MPRTVLFACLLAVLVATPAAQAQSTRTKILRECQEGRLTGDYSASEIRDARNNIPDDVDQYSDCRDVLARALAALAGGGSDGAGAAGGTGAGAGAGAGAGGGGGAVGGGGAAAGGQPLTPSTDADRRALEDAARGGGPVDVGGEPVVPGAAGLASGAPRNTLPSTLLAVLAMLAAAAALGGAPFVRRRVLGPVLAVGSSIRRRVLPG